MERRVNVNKRCKKIKNTLYCVITKFLKMNSVLIIVICILIIFVVFGIYKYLENSKTKVTEEQGSENPVPPILGNQDNQGTDSIAEAEAARKAAEEAAIREAEAKAAAEEAARIAAAANATEEERRKAQELAEALAAAERESATKKAAAAAAEKKLAGEVAAKAAADAAAAEEARRKAVAEAAAKEAAAKAAQEAAAKAAAEAERKRLEAEENARREAEAAAKAEADAKAAQEEAARIAAANARKYWATPETLTALSRELLGETSPGFGIGAIYKPTSAFVAAENSLDSKVSFDVKYHVGVTGTLPLLLATVKKDVIKPLTTTHLAIVKPKNLSFDSTLGSLLLQNLKVFDNKGASISSSLKLLKTANDIVENPGAYQPGFTKAIPGSAPVGAAEPLEFKGETMAPVIGTLEQEGMESDTPNSTTSDSLEWAGILSGNVFNTGLNNVSALLESAGITSLAPIVSQGSVSDSIILTIPAGTIISTVLFEYNFEKFFNGLSGVSAIFNHNIMAWINYCMSNTMVVLLNATGNTEIPATIIAHRTLGALKETPLGFRKTLYFPLRERASTGMKVFNADITGTTFVTTESYIAPKLKQFSEFDNFLSPLDSFNPKKPWPMVTTVPNPDIASELLRETRYPQFNPKDPFHPSSYVQPTSPKVTIGTEPAWATKASDFISLPQCNNTSAVFSVGSIRVDSTKAHGVVVKQIPVYFRVIRKWYKMMNSPDVKNSTPLSLVYRHFTTSTPKAEYRSAEKFQALEDELHSIKTVTGGVEYVIMENSYQVARLPEFSASYPPEPLHIVIYTADMEEIASFQALEFNSIRVYVENP